jgi:hypothetical protein
MSSTIKIKATVRFESKLYRALKRESAATGHSISYLVNDAVRRGLRDTAREKREYERARKEAQKILRKGFPLGGERPPSRDELHRR